MQRQNSTSDKSLPPDAASGPATPKAKPYECSICHCSFRRHEHLQRHTVLHTGEKQYLCPCGNAFSRNDVLVRHLRGCERGRRMQEKEPEKPVAKRMRAKRSCDRCAKSKMKCDYQQPCYRCCHKFLPCEYTREGSHDPYQRYNTGNPTPAAPAVRRISDIPDLPGGKVINKEPDIVDLSLVSPSRSNSHSPESLSTVPREKDSPQLQSELSNMHPGTGADSFLSNPPSGQDVSCGVEMDAVSADFDFSLFDSSTLEVNLLPAFGEMTGQSDAFSTLQESPSIETCETRSRELSAKAMKFDSSAVPFRFPLMQPSWPPPSGGFSIEQIDPVSAKCIEMKNLLRSSTPLVTDDVISRFVTRENVLHFTALFGKHFQHNFPLMHTPTFDLMKTPPIPLLAILCVGACYSDGIIPVPLILKLSMQLLILIEKQPHEINMDVPPLSTIQASLAVCPILASSRSEKARSFVSVYFARNISMAKRAKLFDPVDLVDYSNITEETFNWKQWVDHESRLRAANGIFCQDMTSCVFEGTSPYFYPLDFNIHLPCYEACWRAKSASECLRNLQSMPQQISVSAAVRLICSNTGSSNLFEASGFGMFVLVKSLHCLLYQATHYDLELSLDSAISLPDGFLGSTGLDTNISVTRLQQDQSGATIAKLADAVVELHGSIALKRVNNALNTWRDIWDWRYYRDVELDNHAFIHEPLPFWWLAKLFLLLHYCGHLLSDDSEFAYPKTTSAKEGQGGKDYALMIAGWFSRFRGQRLIDYQSSSVITLPNLFKPVSN